MSAAAVRKMEERRAREMAEEARYGPIRSSAKLRLVELPVRAEEAKAVREAGTKAEQGLQGRRLRACARWSHKNEGTAQTHEHAARTKQGAIARLFEAGSIDRDQLAWACEIAEVAEGIERDVGIGIVSYEPRIDDSRYGKIAASVAEEVHRIRREVAYTMWRDWLPLPRRAVLDMIVGETKSYKAVARDYRIHQRKTKRQLIEALDRWPDALERAEAVMAAAGSGIV